MTIGDDVEVLSKKIRMFSEAGALELDKDAKIAGKKIKLGYDPSKPEKSKDDTPPETKPFSARFSDYSLEPYAGKHYHLTVDGLRFEGVTDGDGTVKADIPKRACAVDADCNAVTAYCDSAGTCKVKKVVGQGATQSNECLSGFSSDGVCCDAACPAGPCDACSLDAGSVADGTCTPLSGMACSDGDACTTVDVCQGGVCVGSSPKSCPSQDQCHLDGVCDSTTGACTPPPKPDGSACDNGNPCSTDSCHAGVCVSEHKTDGTACTGGLCFAGSCVLDPVIGTGSSSSVETGGGGAGGTIPTTTSGTTSVVLTGGGGSGGTVTGGAAPFVKLSGAGCLSVSPGESGPSNAAPAGLLLALLAAWRRFGERRRRAR